MASTDLICVCYSNAVNRLSTFTKTFSFFGCPPPSCISCGSYSFVGSSQRVAFKSSQIFCGRSIFIAKNRLADYFPHQNRIPRFLRQLFPPAAILETFSFPVQSKHTRTLERNFPIALQLESCYC